jgi:phosphate starvation-inducible PhoH-like protein
MRGPHAERLHRHRRGANCTYGQLDLLRGWWYSMVMTGDPDQTDLLPGISGLGQVADRLSTLDDIAVVRLEDRDIVRHPLVAAMLTVL